MRIASMVVFQFLTVVGLPAWGSGAAGEPTMEQIAEFLSWAHPGVEGCDSPRDLRILEKWDERVWVRYLGGCDPNRVLGAVLEVRETHGVVQIVGGIEAPHQQIESVFNPRGPEASRGTGGTDQGGPPEMMEPPPENEGEEIDPSTGRIAVPAVPVKRVDAVTPEPAARSRLIGRAEVELLVEISPGGIPVRLRVLRGPDPDLGMRGAAVESVRNWRFRPAVLAGQPVRSFTPVEVTFEGLPPESQSWFHRALYRVSTIVSRDPDRISALLDRLSKGESFESVAGDDVLRSTPAPFRSDGSGFISAFEIPLPLRRALHESPVGAPAGPVTVDDLHYLIVKRGEIYFAILSARSDEVSYRVLHKSNAPSGAGLKALVEEDINSYLSDARRQSFMNEAARLMGIRQTRTDIGRLSIHTDALDAEEISRLGEVVDATVRVHEDFWGPISPLRPFDQTIDVYAFSRTRDHDTLHRIWRTGREGDGDESSANSAAMMWSLAGEYVSSSRILSIPCETMLGHLPLPIVIHESVHMLNYERVYPSGYHPSEWFEEGLATYFSFSEVDSRLVIQPGQIRRTALIVSGDIRLQFDPRVRLREHLRRVEDEGPVPLTALIEAGADDPLWNGAWSIRAYGASWTLVHFLMNGERGEYRERFMEYAQQEARGKGGARMFRRLFGPDLAALEAAWHDYERRL